MNRIESQSQCANGLQFAVEELFGDNYRNNVHRHVVFMSNCDCNNNVQRTVCNLGAELLAQGVTFNAINGGEGTFGQLDCLENQVCEVIATYQSYFNNDRCTNMYEDVCIPRGGFTPSPTYRPTDRPTRQTPFPTRRPTRRTPYPTSQITREPTPRPTRRTPYPTRRTPYPTYQQTPNPTRRTPYPTRRTPYPTYQQTPNPTRRTPYPTYRQTPNPTPRPTRFPTRFPTPEPVPRTPSPLVTAPPYYTPSPVTGSACPQIETYNAYLDIFV